MRVNLTNIMLRKRIKTQLNTKRLFPFFVKNRSHWTMDLEMVTVVRQNTIMPPRNPPPPQPQHQDFHSVISEFVICYFTCQRDLPAVLKVRDLEMGEIILDYLGGLNVIQGSFEVRIKSQRKRCDNGRRVREMVHCSFWRWRKGAMAKEFGQPLEAGKGKEIFP